MVLEVVSGGEPPAAEIALKVLLVEVDDLGVILQAALVGELFSAFGTSWKVWFCGLGHFVTDSYLLRNTNKYLK